jgi:hypothetical protein
MVFSLFCRAFVLIAAVKALCQEAERCYFIADVA